jgi:hypothetical protein
MKHISKEFKLIKRYAKDCGCYTELKECINEYCKKQNKRPTEITANIPDIISFLQIIRMPGESNEYFSGFKKYIYEQNKNKFIDMFTKFLKEQNVYDKFFNSVNINFIRKALDDTFDITGNTKQELIFDNLLPIGFIMDAFHWEETDEGYEYWSDINGEWENIVRNEEKKENNF